MADPNENPRALRERIKQLEEEKRLYEQIFQSLPIGYQVFDKTGTSQLLNKKQEDLLGLAHGEVGKGKFNVLTDPFAITSGAEEKFRRVYKEKVSLEHEFKYNLGCDENTWNIHKKECTYHENIIPLMDDTGEVEYVVSFLVDYTHIRKVQEELQESEERWKFAIDGNKDGLWDWNIITSEVYFSPQWKAMLGYKEDEISNHLEEWDKRVHPDDKEGAYADINAHLEGKTPNYENEHRLMCKNGEYKWILDRGRIISRTPEGKPERMVGTHRDIDLRKNLEEEMVRSEIKFKSVFELSRTGISITDEQGNIIECNRASERILGITFLEHLNRNFANKAGEIIRPDHTIMPPDELASVRALKEQKAFTEQEMGIVKPDGNITWISLSAVPVPLKGYGVLITYVDISEISRQKQQLIELNNTRDKFFSIIAHDLRSPFNAIKGFSNLLKKNHNTYDEQKRTKLINIIAESAGKASDLLENLLEWSRSQTGTISFKPRLIELEPLFSELLEHANGRASRKGLTFTMVVPKSLKAVADMDMLQTILRNLVDNAFKFTEPGGKVSISATEDAGAVRIAVKDNGIGIPADMHKSLFSIDKKSVSSGTQNEKGNGLGLILCKEFLAKHGQDLSFTTTPGEGTEFYFYLHKNIK